MNENLFENRVFADIMKLRISRSYPIGFRMGLNPMAVVLISKGNGHGNTQRHGEEDNVKTEAMVGGILQDQGRPRIACNQQKLAERWEHRDSPSGGCRSQCLC